MFLMPQFDSSVIHKFIQQQKLTASNAAASNYFGRCVSLSSDGNTLGVTALNKSSVYMYTRSGSTWTQRQEIVIANCYCVCVSPDGSMLAIHAGTSVKTYTRSSNTWTLQQTLTSLSIIEGSTSLCFSSDNNTLAIGASIETITYNQQGATYVFTQSGGTWSQQQKLRESTGSGFAQGYSISLSSDASILAVGAPTSSNGNVYWYKYIDGTWSQQELQASDGAVSDYYGWCISL